MIGADEGAQTQLRAASAQTARLADSADGHTAQPCWHRSGGPAAHRCCVLTAEWVPAQAPRAGAGAGGPQKYASACWRGAQQIGSDDALAGLRPRPGTPSSNWKLPTLPRCVVGYDSVQRAAAKPGLPHPLASGRRLTAEHRQVRQRWRGPGCRSSVALSQAAARRLRAARSCVAAEPAAGAACLARKGSTEKHMTASSRPTASAVRDWPLAHTAVTRL